jgi:membrane-bound lytic murein transglycosylase D
MRKNIQLFFFCVALFALSACGTLSGGEFAGWKAGLAEKFHSGGAAADLDTPERYVPEYSLAVCAEPAWLDYTYAGLYPSTEARYDTDTLPRVPVVMNENVASFLEYFQTTGKGYFGRWLARTSGYMSLVKSILREEGLPEDLSYIALIESGMNPTARSGKSAVGMWQFIEETGRRYGLRVDWWVDERQDPEKSTHAAARYLKKLYNQFDSWYLAAAGYNTGEGRVVKAVARHGTDDFWALASSKKRYFGRETRNYVPKYLAAMIIAKNPEKFGFKGLEYHAEITYDQVTVQQPTDIKVIAEAAGATIDEIKALNPALLRWYTPPDYPDFEVKLPQGTAATYAENIEKIPSAERLVFHRHKVRRGDSLLKISRRYGAPMDLIVYLNEIKDPRLIYPGNMLVVPVRAKAGKKRVASSMELPHAINSGS